MRNDFLYSSLKNDRPADKMSILKSRNIKNTYDLKLEVGKNMYIDKEDLVRNHIGSHFMKSPNFNTVFNFRNQAKFMLVEEPGHFKLVVLTEKNNFNGEGPSSTFVIEEEELEGMYIPACLFSKRKEDDLVIVKKEAELRELEKRIADLKKEINQI
jgi:hypothetical protein